MRLKEIEFSWTKKGISCPDGSDLVGIELEIDTTQLVQLFEQMVNFPDAPNWIYGTLEGVQVKIHAKDNTGVE